MCLALASATLMAAAAPDAWAGGNGKRATVAMSDDEGAALAARAARNPGLDGFEAGSGSMGGPWALFLTLLLLLTPIGWTLVLLYRTGVLRSPF